MRLINADAYRKRIDRYPPEIRDVAKKELRYTPTIAAVEVVRCKCCKHSEEALLPHLDLWCNLNGIYCTYDWFCADGKKRGKEDERTD